MKRKRLLGMVLVTGMFLTSAAGCTHGGQSKAALDPDNPVTVTIWNYYNGDQLTSFENLVEEFNETVGMKEGIVVQSVSQGSIDNLVQAILDTVDGKIGAADMPSAVSVYAETGYLLYNRDVILPLDDYFTDDELDEYVPTFVEEGRFTTDGKLYFLPVSKSTECLIENTTDWKGFSEATGITPESIQTVEDLTAAAEAYYKWTDEQTPDVPEDGKALYGRDSISNYIMIGAKQLGHEILTVDKNGKGKVDLDRATFQKLWDNYYIPYINGYFGTYASYRSEDIKTGTILAMTGSTSSVSYLPSEVTDLNDQSHPINLDIRKALVFEDALDPVSVQQGAGYCVMKTDETQEYATVEFLKWFTDVKQNMEFSVSCGYSPVKLAANEEDAIREACSDFSKKTKNVQDALLISAKEYTAGNTYTSKAFTGSKEVRELLGSALEDQAVKDREAVTEKIKNGQTREEAVAEYSTTEYFNDWFDGVKSQVDTAVQEAQGE